MRHPFPMALLALQLHRKEKGQGHFREGTKKQRGPNKVVKESMKPILGPSERKREIVVGKAGGESQLISSPPHLYT